MRSVLVQADAITSRRKLIRGFRKITFPATNVDRQRVKQEMC
jgi:hypothetical protein